VALAFIGPPRSACRVSWPGATLCLTAASSNKRFEQRGAFRIGDAPGDDPAAENVDDDIEIEAAPFCRPHQLHYVPGLILISAFGAKCRLLIDGAPQLSTPFADFVMFGENAIRGADRAQIDALVEQAGVDFGWSQIDKPRLPQQVEYAPESLAVKVSARQPKGCAGGGDQAATASIKTLRRSPLGGPAALQLFFEVL
jgi:hypothetical protein